MNKQDSIKIELMVAEFLLTKEGKKRFRQALQAAFAKAADSFPEGSRTETLARRLAGLPRRRRPC